MNVGTLQDSDIKKANLILRKLSKVMNGCESTHILIAINQIVVDILIAETSNQHEALNYAKVFGSNLENTISNKINRLRLEIQ